MAFGRTMFVFWVPCAYFKKLVNAFIGEGVFWAEGLILLVKESQLQQIDCTCILCAPFLVDVSAN